MAANETLLLTATLLESIDAQALKPVRKSSCASEVSTCYPEPPLALPWTKRGVLALCEELLQGYCAPQFQAELLKLTAAAPNGYQVAGRMELALTVQSKVLPKYGFPGTLAGVEAMRQALCPFLVDWMVKKLVDDTDRMLGLPPDSTENAAKGPFSWRQDWSEAISRQTTPSTSDFDSDVSSAADTESSTDTCRFRSSGSSDRPSSWSKTSAPKEVKLGKPKVLELLGELLQAYSAAEFQEEFDRLPTEERKELVLKARCEILPKYKLPGNSFGVMSMFDAITPFVDDFLVKYLLSDMDKKLGLSNDTTANICRGKTVEQAPAKTELPKATKLSREQVLLLCSELLAGFQAPDFQEKMQAMIKSSANHKVVPGRAGLALTVQSKVLPKFGIPGTSAGVFQMLEEMAPFASDWMVGRIVNSIDEALGLPAETTVNMLATI